MKKLLFTLIVLLQSSGLFSQAIRWQNTIGGNMDDYCTTSIQTTDGGYLLSGHSISTISGDKTEDSYGGYDFWVVKVNALGVIQWQKTIGGDDFDGVTSIVETSDGGFLLGGSSKSNISGNKTQNSYGDSDYWIVKIDAVGNIQWQKTIGGDGEDILTVVTLTSNGGFLLGGHSWSDISGIKTENAIGFCDYWVIQTDSLGNIQWQNTIGGVHSDFLTSLVPTYDGGFLLGGHSASDISGDKTENSRGNYDYWVVKIDTAGNLDWQKTIGGSEQEWLYSVLQTSDNGYMVSGWSRSTLSGDKTEVRHGFPDCWIVKIDSIGTIQWQKTIGGSGDNRPYAIRQTNDNGFLIGATSDSDISWDKTENSEGSWDIWVVQTDSLGEILWQNTIGGNTQDAISSIIPTTNGELFLSGWSASDISGDKSENSQGGMDFWIMELTDNYNLIKGNIFGDLNFNIVKDLSEPNIGHHKVLDLSTGHFCFSQNNGDYSMTLIDTGNFIIEPDFFNYYSALPISRSVNFNALNQIDSLNDFAFQPVGVVNDLCVNIIPFTVFRAGSEAQYMINYHNFGNTTQNATVVFYPDTAVTFISASLTPISITTDSIVFDLGSVTPLQSGQIQITVGVHIMPIGSLLNSHALILPIVGDANPGCNQSYWEVLTVGSFDPNDILVSRPTLYTTEFPSPPFLDYIIRFQNTGNDTAFTVKIINPIDTNKLDLASLEFVTCSHPVDMQFIYYQRSLEFKFNNILLPDSNINEALSHGFVQYRIKPKNNLMLGDTISNFAAIYFDFNNPVLTNTAITEIISPTALNEINSETFQLFPNPGSGIFTIDSPPGHLQIFNAVGELILSREVVEEESALDLSAFPDGIYFVAIRTSTNVYTEKIVKFR